MLSASSTRDRNLAARAAERFCAELGITLSHAKALNLVARMTGFPHHMAAQAAVTAQAAPEPAPATKDEGISQSDWQRAAKRVYLVAGDTEDEAEAAARWLCQQQDWFDEVEDPYEAALADVEGRPPVAPAAPPAVAPDALSKSERSLQRTITRLQKQVQTLKGSRDYWIERLRKVTLASMTWQARAKNQRREVLKAMDVPDDVQLEVWRRAADELLGFTARTVNFPALRDAAFQLQNAYLFGCKVRELRALPEVQEPELPAA